MSANPLLGAGKVYDLAQPLFNGAPNFSTHPPYRMSFGLRHGDRVLEDGFSSANEILFLSSHSGTHIDAIAHVSEYGKLFGGIDAVANQIGVLGMREAGIDTVGPIIRRGVLLDVATHRGERTIAVDSGVPAGELQEIALAQGVEIRAGDVVLIRTGWGQLWNDAERYVGRATGIAGPNVEAAEWLAAHEIFMTGSDTLTWEWLPPNPTGLPCHRELIVRRGIHLLENANLEALAHDRVYEFALIAAPLNLVGATGGPVRPLAVPLSAS